MSTAKDYTSDSIKNLSFPHNVRHRPGMYIGSTDADGIQTILREVLDNTVDECLEGHCSEVDVILSGRDFTVIDNGRGIPRGKTEVINQGDGSKTMVPTIRAVFGVLSTSGKFSDDAYKVSRGCFTGDTEIRLLDGRTLTMEEIHKVWSADKKPIPILSYSLTTRQLTPSVISYSQIAKRTREIAHVTIDDGSVVKCTYDHPFYVNLDGGIVKVKAEDLRGVDSLVSTYYSADQPASVPPNTYRVVKVELFEYTEKVPVYDVTVDGTHTFFINPGVLVSNSHGIGVKATNALSVGFKVSSFHTGKWMSMSFRRGTTHEDVTVSEAPTHPISGKALTKGTIVKFRPDPEIFGDSNLSKVDLFNWAKMAAYFTPGFKINLYQIKATGEVSERSFSFPEGPKQYVEDRITDLRKVNEFGLISEVFFHSTSTFHDCVIKFTSYDGCDARGFTNGLLNIEGGFHLTSLLTSLRECLVPYLAKKQNFTLNELKDGLVGCINIKMSGPKFDSQTKEKLVDERASEPLKKILLEEFTAFFKKNKALATSLCERASKLKDLKSRFVASKQMLTALKKISKKGFPAKAATSPKCKPHERELYLLEGDSAAGGGRFARDEYYQEFLPMKGKCPNIWRAKPGAEITNEEILNVFAMLGFDPRQEDPYDKLRVGKIIIMSDSDADGSHISALLLGVFYKYLPELFEKGMIYVTRVPEYYAVHKDIVYSGNTLDETQASLDASNVSAPINHLKGYGECPSDLLKIFAFEPTTRSLYKVSPCVDDKFELLMSNDSTSRKLLLNI